MKATERYAVLVGALALYSSCGEDNQAALSIAKVYEELNGELK